MAPRASTREKLIQVAIELFHEQGVHWVSFQQISSKLGISQPALYKYFDDKDDLICACILSAASEGRKFIDSRVDPEFAPKQKIRDYLEANLIWLRSNPKEGAAVLAMYYFAFNSPKIREVFLAINQQSVDRMASLLMTGKINPTWKMRECRQFARVIHDLLLGEMIKAIHSPDEFSVPARMKMLWAAVLKLLD